MVLCDRCGEECRLLGKTGRQICPKCGTVYSDEHTEKTAASTYCHKCGSEIPSGTGFCVKCGIELKAIKPPENALRLPSRKKSLLIICIVIILVAVISLIILQRYQTSHLMVPQASPLPSSTPGSYTTIFKGHISSQGTRSIQPSGEMIRESAYSALDWFSTTYGVELPPSEEVYRATAIFWYVYSEIRYVEDPRGSQVVQLPSETLTRKQGDCEDRALLMAALYESLGLDALFAHVDTDGNGKIDHALTLVYFGGTPVEFTVTQERLWGEVGAYPLDYEIMYVEEPSLIYLRDDGEWVQGYKYETGIWVTLENWEYSRPIQVFDVEYADFTSSEGLRELLDLMTYGFYPRVHVDWRYLWPGQQSEPMVVTVTVDNYGKSTVRGLVVWAGLSLDADSNVYDEKRSDRFDLKAGESAQVTLHLTVPRGVDTRVCVKVWGENLDLIEDYGEWFTT